MHRGWIAGVAVAVLVLTTVAVPTAAYHTPVPPGIEEAALDAYWEADRRKDEADRTVADETCVTSAFSAAFQALGCRDVEASAEVVTVRLEDGDVYVTLESNAFVDWGPLAGPLSEATGFYGAVREDFQEWEVCRSLDPSTLFDHEGEKRPVTDPGSSGSGSLLDRDGRTCRQIIGYKADIILEGWPDIEGRVPDGAPIGSGAADGRPETATGTVDRPGDPELPAVTGGDLYFGRQSLSNGLVETDPVDAGVRGLVTWTAIAVGTLAVLVLYRRLTRDDILDNEIRTAMLSLVRDRPGIHATEVAQRLDVTVQTIQYHARILDDADLLVRRPEGKKIVFFVPGEHGPVDKDLLYVLNQDGKRDLMQLLRDEPGLGISEAARRLDRCRSTVKHHVDQLEERGVVETRRDGRSRRIDLPAEVVAGLDRLADRA